jgi:hypothetical protein
VDGRELLVPTGAQAGRWHEIDHELQIGAWVNVRDEARRTVLLWAARSGACEAVTNLVNKTRGVTGDGNGRCFGWEIGT